MLSHFNKTLLFLQWGCRRYRPHSLDMCSGVARRSFWLLTRTLCADPCLTRSRHIPPCVRRYTKVSATKHVHRATACCQDINKPGDGDAVPYLTEQVSPDDTLVQRLYKGLLDGKRGLLAEAITLIESTHPRKQAKAQLLLSKVMQHARDMGKETKKPITSFRIGEILLCLSFVSWFMWMIHTGYYTNEL